jgi:hypothetical protein
MTEQVICGITSDKIRKSFFTGKVEKLLTDIQASGEYDVSEYEQLSGYLSSLKEQSESLSKNFSSFLPKIETEMPDTVLDELNRESLSEAEVSELDREKSNREFSVSIASKLLKSLFVRFHGKDQPNPSEEELMDIAFEVLGLQYYLIRDALYKERLYRKKIVEFERTGKQRKLAEEAAKTTVEYRDYYLAEGLKDLANEYINLAKRRYKSF